jgi:hypothetical protein
MKFSKLAKAGLDELAKHTRANNCDCEHCRTTRPQQLALLNKARKGADISGEDMGELVCIVDNMLAGNETAYADSIALCIMTDLHMKLGLPHVPDTRNGIISLIEVVDDEAMKRAEPAAQLH